MPRKSVFLQALIKQVQNRPEVIGGIRVLSPLKITTRKGLFAGIDAEVAPDCIGIDFTVAPGDEDFFEPIHIEGVISGSL